MAIIPSFFGRLFSEGAGVAVGTAAAKGVEPPLQNLANTMESAFANKPIDAVLAAALRARESLPDYPGIDLGDVSPKNEAGYSGVRGKRFDALTELAREHPSVGELLNLRRRNLALGAGHGITQDEFREWLRRQGLTKNIINAITRLLVEYLSPADVANAVQQGFMPDDGILPTPTPPNPDWVATDGAFTIPVEQLNIDPSNEAAVHGLDKDRLKILSELVGLPPGEETLLDMWRRGIIGPNGYAAGLREGHTKTKWTAALSARFYQLLPPSVLVNLRIRGWITDADYHGRMKRHGYRASQAQDWFDSIGRPATTHQAYIGVTRGGTYDGPTTGIPDYFKKAVLQSNIRPEWTNILWAGHYTLPSAFVFRRLLQDGAISADNATMFFEHSGWPPDLARTVANHYAASATTGGSAYIGKADSQLWATTHRTFIARETNVTQARAAMRQLGISTDDQTNILARWQAEQALIRKQLTPAQLKKAFVKAAKNEATGVPWTRDEVIAELVAQGYSVIGAEDYLNIP